MADSDDEVFEDAIETGEGASAEDDDDLSEFDGEAIADLPSGVDREILADNVARGVRLFFDNEYRDAENTFAVYKDSDTLHALAYGVMSFLRAIMTFSEKEMQEAHVRLRHAQGLAYALLKKQGKVGGSSFSKLFSKGKKEEYSPTELDALVIMAESHLLSSSLLFFQESIAAYVKGSLGLRKGWKLYEQSDRILKACKDASVYDCNTLGGIQFGIGNFNMVISMLPQKVLKIVSFFGFPADQAEGLRLLSECMSTDNFRSPLASLALLTYHAVFPGFFSTHDTSFHVQEAEKVLDLMLSKYPRSAMHLWNQGRLNRLKRDIPASLVSFTKAMEAQSEFRQLHHMIWYELGWSHLIGLEFAKARPYFENLAKESDWSKAFYTYAQVVCFMAEGNDAKADEMMAGVTDMVNRKFGGRIISVEQFILRKAKTYFTNSANKATMPLAHLELIYLWNGFSQMDRSLLEKALKMAEEYNAKVSSADAPNSLAVGLLLKGVALRELGSNDACAECFKELEALESRVDEEKWVIPFANYERANLAYTLGDSKGSDRLLKKAKETTDYNFEFRLHFRIHLSSVAMKKK